MSKAQLPHPEPQLGPLAPSDAPAHRVVVEGALPAAGQVVQIDGDEARHALSVKRLRVGERVDVLDGRGGVARATLMEPLVANAKPRNQVLRLSVISVERVAEVMPKVEVWSATPKGDRLTDLVDQLSQVGAASWTPLVTQRTQADPPEHKRDRLRRVAVEAMKQCGRAWLLTIGEPMALSAAMMGGVDVVVADASGGPYVPSGHGVIRVLVGPEGGWTPEELAMLKSSGARVARFGPHVMRIETAAVAACAAIMACVSVR